MVLMQVTSWFEEIHYLKEATRWPNDVHMNATFKEIFNQSIHIRKHYTVYFAIFHY